MAGALTLAAGTPAAALPRHAAHVPSADAGLRAGDRYVVRPGDTLSSIAEQAGVRRSDLAALNGLADPNLVRIGETLTIPGRGSAPTTTTTTRPAPPAAGTALLRLGASGPPVADLQRRLRTAGQKVVADGAFGPRTEAAVRAFQQARGLDVDGVAGPRTLAALGASKPATQLPATPQPVASDAGPWKAYGAVTYTTRPGDTWASIAKARGTTPQGLTDANRRKPSDRFSAGTTLVVPGSWRCPVERAIFINDWGFPRTGHRHQGNDLFAPRGRAVLAPVSGRVERYPNRIGGNAVRLHGDDGNRYYFAHLDAYGAVGRVKAGTQIGTVGNSGNAEGTITHLHFEIRPGGGEAVNPFPSLSLACRKP